MKIGPDQADCFVYTEREGMLSPVGHDLKIEVTDFEVEVEDGQIRAKFDAHSLEVVGSIKKGELDPDDPKPKDKKKIESNIVDDVLESDDHPTIEFRSESVERDGEVVRIEGTLSLHGVEKSIAFEMTHQLEEWATKVSIHQPDFDIKPYKALMGQLRLKADVEVEFRMAEDDFEEISLE